MKSCKTDSESCGTEHTSRNWLSRDGCGIICVGITWMLLLFAEYVVVRYVLAPWSGMHGKRAWVHTLIFSTLIGLALAAHFKAMTTNPGAVPPEALPVDYEPESRKRHMMCKYCQSFKPERAHHCHYCKRCVVKMDHHCPWVNNCVGVGNHKFFLLFLLYVFFVSGYALALIGSHFWQCSTGGHRRHHRGARHTPKPTLPECKMAVQGTLLMFLVIIEGLLFGLFTLCMMCDQWGVMLYATTQIDRMQGKKFDKRSRCDNLTEVFGGEPRFSVKWLMPVDILHLDPESVMGYRVLTDEELEMGELQNEQRHNNNGDEGDVVLSVEDGGMERDSRTDGGFGHVSSTDVDDVHAPLIEQQPALRVSAMQPGQGEGGVIGAGALGNNNNV